MTLPLDYARCADGHTGCPRAGTCARMVADEASRASLWFAAMWRDRTIESELCRFYIPTGGRAVVGEVGR